MDANEVIMTRPPDQDKADLSLTNVAVVMGLWWGIGAAMVILAWFM